MGANGTKEPPRNITVENQLLMTEAALQQLQTSVSKGVPQAVNTRPSDTDSTTTIKATNNKMPLPTIDTHGTVETWRALASSVNDAELQRLRKEYKEKLLDQERYNREKLNLTKENLENEIEKVEKKFSKYIYSPICELERADIEKCYLANPKQVLTCSSIAEKFIQCVQYHREQSLRSSQPTKVIPSNNKEIPNENTQTSNPSSSETPSTADNN